MTRAEYRLQLARRQEKLYRNQGQDAHHKLRARKLWQSRPVSQDEADTFDEIRAWTNCGASLSIAVGMTCGESRFAQLVGELEAGRNSSFAENLTALLKIPWHYSERPSFYRRDASGLGEKGLCLAMWSD